MTYSFSQSELLSFTSQLIGAYASNRSLPVEELPVVITRIYTILSDITKNIDSLKNRPSRSPAVPVEESVQDAYIVCLEDGKKLQMLKRHLRTVYKMSLAEYKDRWSLPLDYPVVSPSYARRRSKIAKNTGFGLKGRPRTLNVIVEQGNNEQTQRVVAVG